MGNETKHTPLPWRLDWRATTRIVSESGRGIASAGGPFNNQEEDGGVAENNANAKFIELACNCHNELLEACKKAMTCQSSMNSDVVALIRDAIAKATPGCQEDSRQARVVSSPEATT